MIHQVAIKSLPQEWLWCETWCSNDDKPAAKTIDLVGGVMGLWPVLCVLDLIVVVLDVMVGLLLWLGFKCCLLKDL